MKNKKNYQKIIMSFLLLLTLFIVNSKNVSAKVVDVSTTDQFKNALKYGDDINLKNDITIPSDQYIQTIGLKVSGNGYTINANNNTLNFEKEARVIMNDVVISNFNKPVGYGCLNLKLGGYVELNNVKARNISEIFVLNGNSNSAKIKNSVINATTVGGLRRGSLELEGKNDIKVAQYVVSSAELVFKKGSENNITSSKDIAHIHDNKKVSKVIAEQDSINNLTSHESTFYFFKENSTSASILLEENAKMNVMVGSEFNSTCLDTVTLNKNAELNIQNNDNTYAYTLMVVKKSIAVDNGAKFAVKSVARQRPLSRVLILERGAKNIDVKAGGSFRVENIPGKYGIVTTDSYLQGIMVDKASVSVNERKYQGVSGYLALSDTKVKATSTSNGEMNREVNGQVHYKLVVEPVDKSPIISVKVNPITYYNGQTVSEAKFLSDIGAQSDNNTVPILSNFATSVNLSSVGTYNVTLKQVLASGVEANPVNVVVNVRAYDKPIISIVNKVAEYTKGSTVTESQFLSDLGATSTNATAPIKSNFNTVNFNVVDIYFITLTQELASGEKADPVQAAVIIKEDPAPIININDSHLFKTAGTAPTITEKEVLNLYNASTVNGEKITTDMNLRNLNKVGFYTFTVSATSTGGKTTTKVVKMIVVHDIKTIYNDEMILHSDDLVLSSSEAKTLTEEQVKSAFFADVKSFDINDGTDLYDKVIVDQNVLRQIKASRVPATYNLPIKVTYKGKTLQKDIIVRVER